jgi:signal recognition particle subunit SRP54
MMKTVARGGTPNIPGMGSMPGMGKPGASSKRGKKGKSSGGSRSGNPAKRAAENAGIASASTPTGSGFGLGGQKAPSEADLAEIQKLFGKN